MQGLAVTLACLVIATLVILAVAGYEFAKMQHRLSPLITQQLRDTLGRDVRLGSVHLQGWDTVVIRNAAIAKGTTFASGEALSTPKVTAHVNLLSYILHRNQNPVQSINLVTLQQPVVSINRSKQGQWDFQDIVDRVNQHRTVGTFKTKLIVQDGKVAYHDEHGIGPNNSQIDEQLLDVNGNLTPTLTSGNYRFAISGNEAEHKMGQLRLTGQYSSETGVGDINASASRIAVKALLQYIPRTAPITFENGTAAVRISALFHTLPNPKTAHRLPATALTAEVDLSGVGLRLQEMSTPIVATTGQLRLVHNPNRYPNGSRIDFIGVHARAGNLPVLLTGSIEDLNLLDLAHVNPQFNVTLATSTDNGGTLTQLFPSTPWLQKLQLHGRLAVLAHATGRPANLHINGVISGERFSAADLQGNNIDVNFNLFPSGSTHGQPTITATAQVKNAKIGSTEFQNLNVSGNSVTPWRHLDDSLQFNGTADAGKIHLKWGDMAEFAHVHGKFAASKEHIILSGVSAKALGGDISGDFTFPFYSRQYPDEVLHADATYSGVDLSQLAKLVKINGLGGTGSGTLTLAIKPDNTVLIATKLTGKQVTYQRYMASLLTAEIQAQTQHQVLTVNIPTATASTEYGKFIITDGQYVRQDGNAITGGNLNMPLTGEDLHLQKFAKEMTGTASLQGTLTGNPSQPLLTATVTAHNGSVIHRAFQNGQGEMTMQGKDLRFRNVVFTRPGMSVTIPGGTDGFDPRKGFRDVPATLQVDGAPLQEVLDLLNQRSPWVVDGSTQGKAEIRLTEKGVVASGSANIPHAVVHIPFGNSDYPLALDQLGLQFDLTGRSMQIHDLLMQRGSSAVHAQGTAFSNADGQLEMHVSYQGNTLRLEELPLDLFDIPVALTGPADANGTVDGVLNGTGATPLKVTVRGTSSQLAAEGVPVGNGSVALTYSYRPDDRQLTVENGTISNPAFQATSSGTYNLSARQMNGVHVDVTNIDLTELKSLLANSPAEGRLAVLSGMAQSLSKPLGGHGSVNVQANGNFTHPEIQLGVNFAQLMLGNTPLPNLRAQLASDTVNGRYGLRIIDAVAEGGNGQGRAQFNGQIDPSGRLNLQYTMRDITPAVVSSWIKVDRVSGSAALTGTITGPWKSPVVDSDIAVTNPGIAQYHLHRAEGHIHVTRDSLAVTNGALWATAESKPISVQGNIPLATTDGKFDLAGNKSMSFTATLPRQNLSVVRALIPSLPAANGTIEGQLHIGGTVAAPRVTNGIFTLAGSAALPQMDSAYPNRINNINLRLRLADNNGQNTVTVDRLSATMDRVEGNKRADGFKPGWITAQGSAVIKPGDLMTPDKWNWNMYAEVIRFPLSPDLFMVPNISGYLHLQNKDDSPTLTGVMLAEQVKIKEPKMPTSTASSWGPFNFNPRLSVVLQIGEGVKMAKSILRLPLRPTPLPWPQLTVPTTDSQPSLQIHRNDPAFNYNASMLNPGTSAELSGTWGVVTGSLDNPQLYARFEVDKKKVGFPFNLFSSITKARGHITYSMADGPSITMGIPDFPQPAPSTQAKATTVSTAVPAAGDSTPPTPAASSTTQPDGILDIGQQPIPSH